MKNLNTNKKGQTGGLVTGLVFGIAALVIGAIIAFIIVSTLSNANLLTGSRTSATYTEDDTKAGFVPLGINKTGFTITNYNSVNTAGIAVVTLYGDANQSDGTQAGLDRLPSGYTLVIPSANYSISAVGYLTNATTFVYPNVSLTYTITSYSNEEHATTGLSGNLTSGVNNVSAKIPTVLLIAAIVLILGVLAVLVGVWAKMRMGGGSI